MVTLLFNDCIDLFNIRVQLPVDKFKKNLQYQHKLLKTMDNFILEMRVVGHKTFQKGEKYFVWIPNNYFKYNYHVNYYNKSVVSCDWIFKIVHI